MTNSKLLFISIILFSSSLLTSCNKTKESKIEINQTQTPANDVIQLKIVGHWLGEGKREKLIREYTNEYEFLNQNIKIQMVFPEELYKGEKGEQDFIISQITKPVADYDIIRLKSHYPTVARLMNDENWGTKYLVDFYNVPGFKEAHIESLDLVALKKRTGDICVSPCIEGNYEAMYANLNIAKKIGISIKQYGMTYEDFKAYLIALNNYNKANHTNIMAIFENDDNGWLTTETIFKRLFFSLLNGYTEINNTNYSEKKIHALEQTYKAYEELAQYNPIRKNKDRINIDWGRDNDYPLKDSCLFFVNGSYMYNIWDSKDNKALSKMLPCELPVFKPSDSYIGDYSSNWCVPKNAPHREEAIKMLMYWCKPIMSEKWVRYTKCPTGIKGNLATNSFGIDAFEDFQFTINKKYNNKLIPSSDFRLVTGEKNNIQLLSTRVLGGAENAEEAIRNMRKKLKKN